MPSRKEPKEAVVYPASKRKPPPFKPQRPSKVPRSMSATTATTSQPVRRRNTAPAQQPRERTSAAVVVEDSEADSPKPPSRTVTKTGQGDDASASSSDLPGDPLELSTRAATNPAPARDVSPVRHSASSKSLQASPHLRQTSPSESLPLDGDVAPVPQNLLVRLLHEHFVEKSTKIDKNAIQVLQKYVEIFIREAIARAALHKRDSASRTDLAIQEATNVDSKWLELEDLERIAAGMMLDF